MYMHASIPFWLVHLYMEKHPIKYVVNYYMKIQLNMSSVCEHSNPDKWQGGKRRHLIVVICRNFSLFKIILGIPH